MPKTRISRSSGLVRASRDGDQFHYLWTARRCLQLLEPSPRLVAVAVEGPAPKASRVIADEEVIDVAEYYGSEDFYACHRVEYIQLKHSTIRTAKAWTLSELKATIERFAGIFRSRCEEYGLDAVGAKLRFRIVSNRPFGPSVVSGTLETSRLPSTEFEGVLALGDKLVAELELSAEVDTLARGMAHYLAELLLDARSNYREPGGKENAKIFVTVLELWKHRQNFPEKSRPFRDFKPICRVLDSLDLDTNRPRFFTYRDDSSTEKRINSSTNLYLTAIRAIDKSARLLIQFAIQLATEQEADAGLEWLRAAQLAGVADDDEAIAIRFIVAGEDIPRIQDANAERLQKVDRALAALELFLNMARVMADRLRSVRGNLSQKVVTERTRRVPKGKRSVKAEPK